MSEDAPEPPESTDPIDKFTEPETRWEAFISGKQGQTGRNRQIWLDAMRRLGADE
jgi:hypothetical protein